MGVGSFSNSVDNMKNVADVNNKSEAFVQIDRILFNLSIGI